ncbi:MAG: cob(I)yrinic acid a,c-diamide adenosyltransferase [Myxococcota bacterium]|nr:cob(I)yrinic acid a,c-diamide adenosyltransferase [Myxococcota bacterium]
MRIYTKTGDQGQTGLVGGDRVAKDDIRVEAYGEVDELNGAVGLARADCQDKDLDSTLGFVQQVLFELGAELATPPEKRKRSSGIVASDIARLEKVMDAADDELEPLKTFIMPGGNRLAAHLHLARSICRRAERRAVQLKRNDAALAEEPLIFLNRLSDCLFIMARLACHRSGDPEVLWEPRPVVEEAP